MENGETAKRISGRWKSDRMADNRWHKVVRLRRPETGRASGAGLGNDSNRLEAREASSRQDCSGMVVSAQRGECDGDQLVGVDARLRGVTVGVVERGEAVYVCGWC